MEIEAIGYKKLIVWQKADVLAFEIYKTTRFFPKEETYGIISQIRRASLSVPLNIVEGYGRRSKGELKQFVKIALGSLTELEYLLEFSFRLNYFEEKDFLRLQALRKEVGNLLWKFFKSLQ